MRDPYQYPKLRWPLDVKRHAVDGREFLVLNCPIGVAEKPLGLVAAVGPIISSFDGNSSVEEVAERFSQYSVTAELVRELVQTLDQGLFLATPRYFEAENQNRRRFENSEFRPAALAGAAYPAIAERLIQEIDGYVKQGNGSIAATASEKLVGLMVPHIDYRRGSVVYGDGYRYLEGTDPNLIILIGTSHQYSRLLFHLTQKHFETPLGVAYCDKEFVNNLAAKYGVRSFRDEILHKNEHSLELQLPFLKRLAPRAKIVPILVGSFHQFLNGRSPADFDEYSSFVGSLAELVHERIRAGERVCVVAGVDTAHIGRDFGDQGSLSANRLQHTRIRDELYLDSIDKQDKLLLLQHIAEDSDQRRICGYPTMYTVIDLFDQLGIRYQCRRLGYRQAVDYERDCCVTFAAAGFYH